MNNALLLNCWSRKLALDGANYDRDCALIQSETATTATLTQKKKIIKLFFLFSYYKN